MEDQLREVRDWAVAAFAEEAQRMQSVAEFVYTYDTIQLDKKDDRPLIHDFLDYAEWSVPSRAKDRSIPRLM